MTLEQLKNKITTKDLNDITVVIFKDKDKFISTQYINSIAEILNKEIVYYDDYNTLVASFSNAWIVNNNVNVLKVDDFKLESSFSPKLKNTFIVCDKTDVPCIDVPKLVDWQIKEYIDVNLDIDSEKLYNLCNGNIWRIQNEIDKLKLFPSPRTQLDRLVIDGQYSDVEDGVIWDYITALFNKDINKCRQMIPKIMSGACDVTDYFLCISIYNKLIKIIKVKLNPNPTPENTGLTSKQIWAIQKYEAGRFSVDQLYRLFHELIQIEVKVKRGEFDTSTMVDYITVLFLGR